MLKTPVRAEMSTGTVVFMHTLAVAEPASSTNARADCACIVSGGRV